MPADQALTLRWSENLMPIFQPAHSPELKPIERCRQFIQQQIKGENFATLPQRRERLRHVLQALTAEHVPSLTSYNFILEALSCHRAKT